MGKTFLKIFVVFMLGAGCYLGFISLFTFVRQHAPVSHDWIFDLSAGMQMHAVYGQNLITELVVAVP
ncbi:MAG: hypothetical protein K9L30_03105 [Desulfobacterales bacterium]|nr:hypothetical protein [Desulfobacterales bacterium]